MLIVEQTDMFGPRAPYKGSEDGSPLNNFIAANGGKRCIVFLDEFEKTDDSVRQALLIPFQNGTFSHSSVVIVVLVVGVTWSSYPRHRQY